MCSSLNGAMAARIWLEGVTLLYARVWRRPFRASKMRVTLPEKGPCAIEVNGIPAQRNKTKVLSV
jgi:hypothetical protein